MFKRKRKWFFTSPFVEPGALFRSSRVIITVLGRYYYDCVGVFHHSPRHNLFRVFMRSHYLPNYIYIFFYFFEFFRNGNLSKISRENAGVKVARWKKPLFFSIQQIWMFPPKNWESGFCFSFSKEDNWVPHCKTLA